MSIDNLLTPEQIQAAIEGANIGGSLKDGLVGPTTFTPSTHTPITGQEKELKPRVRDSAGNTIEQSLVTAPNTSKYNQLNAKRKLDELDAAEKRQAEAKALSPEALNATIQVLDRKVRKLEKIIKELTTNDSTPH